LDLLYEYVTMDGGRYSSIRGLINPHPRIQRMKEWVIRNPIYDRVTQKISLDGDPYYYKNMGRKQREILQLRDDFVDDFRKKERMKQYIDGRLQMSIPIQPRQRVEKESVFKRMINLLKLK
jgi:hypothetical protein